MSERFVPAAGRAALTGLYDPVLRLTLREGSWRPKVVRRTLAGGGRDVLDLGCGTGTLAVELARAGAHVIGVDGDEQVLARAARKARRAGVELDLRVGLADAVSLEDGSVDRVVCSLLLHHLVPAAKAEALAECRRVLRGGGRLLIADWGAPADPLQRLMFTGLRMLDGFEGTRDHAAGRLADAVATAGFAGVCAFERLRTPWGTLELLEAGN